MDTNSLANMVKVFRARTKGGRRRQLSSSPSSWTREELSTMLSEIDSFCAGEGDATSTTSQLSSLSIRTDASALRCVDDSSNNRDYHSQAEYSYRATTQRQGGPTKDPVLSMVVYEQSPSLSDAAQLWFRSAHALLLSKEMSELTTSSRDVVLTAGGTILHTACMVIQIACLPITFPYRVVASTTEAVLGTTGVALGVAGNVLLGTPKSVRRLALTIESHDHQHHRESCENASSESSADGLIGKATKVIPFIFQTVGRVTNEAGVSALRMVLPAQSSEERSAEQDNSYLDRLRLDYGLPKQLTSEFNPADDDCARRLVNPVNSTLSCSSDVSKYLLRVNDVNFESSSSQDSQNHEGRILYIDLSKEFSDDSLRKQMMDLLVARGLAFASTNAYSRSILPGRKTSSFEVEWKPEGCTAKTIRKLSKMSQPDQDRRLSKEVLVWSGKFQGPSYYGSENPVFLAQGIVDLSPREFLNLMWNSDRAGEYNKYSLGRSDMVLHEDGVLSGGSYGTKVIKSETKVPFAGISLVFSAVMHARALEGNPDEGFVIVSRSLDCGVAGSHVGSCKGVEKASKNEILLGVNILRPVPGSPGSTHLISLSQVNATLVPPFLAKRIGLMGVEDFFKHVRTVSASG